MHQQAAMGVWSGCGIKNIHHGTQTSCFLIKQLRRDCLIAASSSAAPVLMCRSHPEGTDAGLMLPEAIPMALLLSLCPRVALQQTINTMAGALRSAARALPPFRSLHTENSASKHHVKPSHSLSSLLGEVSALSRVSEWVSQRSLLVYIVLWLCADVQW